MKNESASSRNREKIVLLAYTIYSAAAIVAAFIYNWENWTAPLILGCMMGCAVLYFKRVRIYFFRAFCTSLAAWITLSIDLAHTRDFISDFALVSALIVLLSIYCLPELSYLSTAIFSFHLIYRFSIGDIDLHLNYNGLLTIVRILSVYLVILLTDIMMKTQSEANKKLQENYDSIHRAEQTKDDFLANISHEIRTPVNTVCGISEIILREELPEDVREEIYDIQNAGRNLLSIVSDILDFTELNSGKSEINEITYNMTSTINDILNMTIPSITDRGLELIIDCDPKIPCALVGDEEKIRRAVMNILDNAIKFTREGGIILTVTTRREAYGVNLIFSIRDTGIGMNEQALENLFTSYAQVDTRRNRQESGLGLGMFITKNIVNRMGGFMTVNSVPGKGTEIKLIFPQKVVDEEPIVALNDPDNIKVLLYIDMEKYQYSDIRNGYADCIRNMAEDLRINFFSCRSLGEVKRRVSKETFSHVFVSWEEYSLDKDYFNDLSDRLNVVLVLDRNHKESVSGRNLLCIYKPFYVLSIVAVLNGQYTKTAVGFHSSETRFTAPTARVMIVDDNLMNLKVTEGLLRPYKIKINLAGSGSDALKKLDAVKPDFIFMDHMMPEMDGVETFHRIRAKAGIYFQNVPVIVLTANAVSGAREMFLSEGFADYITKPIELSSLERILRTYIPESKLIKMTDLEEEKTHKTSIRLDLDGIDSTLGIDYCGGSVEDYIDIVRVYYDIGTLRTSEIRRHFENKDLDNYTILVHAVKSTSLNIGAVKLSGMAERLETAGKRHKIDEIEAHTEDMLKEYERVLKVIRSSPDIFPEIRPELSEQTGKSDIQPDDLDSKLAELSQTLDTFEMEKVQECIDALSGYSVNGKSLSELLSGIIQKAAAFDFMGAAEELEELRRNVR